MATAANTSSRDTRANNPRMYADVCAAAAVRCNILKHVATKYGALIAQIFIRRMQATRAELQERGSLGRGRPLVVVCRITFIFTIGIFFFFFLIKYPKAISTLSKQYGSQSVCNLWLFLNNCNQSLWMCHQVRLRSSIIVGGGKHSMK